MTQLIKIRDVSSKYDISARTLRYYEQMGLISSRRSGDYAYRLYDHIQRQAIRSRHAIDGDGESCQSVYQSICQWVERSGFALDERPGHCTMCHMLNPSQELHKALGYDQMDIYVPIRIKA